MKTDFSGLIKGIRKKYNLTQKDLANLFEPPIKQQSINSWEKGTCNPDQKHQSKIAELAGIELGDLIGKITNNNKPDVYDIIQDVDSLSNEDVDKLLQSLVQKKIENKRLEDYLLMMLKMGADNWNNWMMSNKQDVYLENINFNNINLTNFDGYDLSNITMVNCGGTSLSFDEADLSNANLSYSKFKNSSFVKASLENSILENASLTNCNLSKVFAYRINLKNAVVDNCSLSLSTFVEANLLNASIINCSISNTNFMQTNLNIIGASKNIIAGNDSPIFNTIIDAVNYQFISFNKK